MCEREKDREREGGDGHKKKDKNMHIPALGCSNRQWHKVKAPVPRSSPLSLGLSSQN